MSPELLAPERFGLEKTRPTKESDCYALGMVIYEVLSGHSPFAPSKGPMVILKVMEGERPKRPQGEEGKLFTDAMWEVLELCWKPQPSYRPSAKAIILCLEDTPSRAQSSFGVNGVARENSSDQSDDMTSDSGTFPMFIYGL